MGVGQGFGGGRPKAFTTIAALKKGVNAYFSECDNNKTKRMIFQGVQDGYTKKTVPDPDPYTIEGLAYHLRISRRTLLNYEDEEDEKKNGKFFPTIRDAKDRILAQKVKKGLKNETNSNFTIFDLKNNYGYIDRHHIDETTREGKPIDPLDKKKMLDV